MDDDGLVDCVVDENGQSSTDWKNTGTATAPAFTQQLGAANTFLGVVTPSLTDQKMSLVDMDGDYDLDCLVGGQTGNIANYENTGAVAAALFTELGASSPFIGIAALGGIAGGMSARWCGALYVQ